MNSTIDRIPWQLLQSFSVIVETGSLSGAARSMNVSQPTLSRHLSVLEKKLGERLFLRTSEGMSLTPVGESFYGDVQRMAESAARLKYFDVSQSEPLSGTVRISASQITATYLLPAMLTELHQIAPKLSIEVVSSDDTHNLIRREADIAVRMYRPTQRDIFVKKAAEFGLGVFASSRYLEQRGHPTTFHDLKDHDVIGYDRSSLIIDGFKQIGMTIDREFFTFRCDDQVVCWNMVKAGYGIGFMQVGIGEQEPDLVRIEPDIDVGTIPVWLAAHKELKTSPRVRATFDHLAKCFQNLGNLSK